MEDEKFMLRAIEIAEIGGRISTAPNPWVGCVIVKNGIVIAEGFHQRKGDLHAERNALNNVPHGCSTSGATAYVTLEPCCHHGATPPCTDALIEAGITRVVVAIGSDPDENVSGNGIEILKNFGISVQTGICESKARESLRAYLHHRKTGRPYVIVKVGMSMNGKIAYQDGTSKWITSTASREEAMRIRAESQAILVGVNTVITDNPRLTLRGPGGDSDRGIVPFTRIVIDPCARLTRTSENRPGILSDGAGPVLIFTTVEVPSNGQVEWIQLPQIDLKSILSILANRGILQVLVEGGSRTLENFFDENLVNELVLFMAPTLIGSGGLSFYNAMGPGTVGDKRMWRLGDVRAVENGDGDIRISYRSFV